MRPDPLVRATLALGLAFLAAGCDGDEAEPDPADGPDVLMLFRFEQFTSADRTDGGEITLRSLAGKVVLLNLFGTWSAPCRRSTPLLVSLYERYREQGFEILALAYEQTRDVTQTKRAAEAYRSEFSVPYVLAVGSDVLWKELRQNARVVGDMPTFVLMDRQGVVRDLFEGLPPGREAVLADRIERLLAEPYVAVPGQDE